MTHAGWSSRRSPRPTVSPSRRARRPQCSPRRRCAPLATSTTRTVTLSRLPRRTASSTSRSAASCGSVGRGEQGRDLGVVELVGEAVRAHQHPVGRADGQQPVVGLRVGSGAQGARDDVPVRVPLSLGRLDHAAIHQLLDHRVVHADLGERAVGVPVHPGVADVEDQPVRVALVTRDRDAGERGADGAPVGYRLAQSRGDRADHLVHVVGADLGPPGQRTCLLDRDPGGDLARLVPAHAVGHHEDRRVGQQGVLVQPAEGTAVRRRPPGGTHSAHLRPVLASRPGARVARTGERSRLVIGSQPPRHEPGRAEDFCPTCPGPPRRAGPQADRSTSECANSTNESRTAPSGRPAVTSTASAALASAASRVRAVTGCSRSASDRCREVGVVRQVGVQQRQHPAVRLGRRAGGHQTAQQQRRHGGDVLAQVGAGTLARQAAVVGEVDDVVGELERQPDLLPVGRHDSDDLVGAPGEHRAVARRGRDQRRRSCRPAPAGSGPPGRRRRPGRPSRAAGRGTAARRSGPGPARPPGRDRRSAPTPWRAAGPR